MSIYGYVLFNHKTKLAIKPIYCSVPFHQQFIASIAHSYQRSARKALLFSLPSSGSFALQKLAISYRTARQLKRHRGRVGACPGPIDDVARGGLVALLHTQYATALSAGTVH